MAVDISAAPVTEQRTVTYSFPGHEFAPADRMSCAVANGPLTPVPTSTTSVDTTTTVLATTTTVAETTTTTVAPTTTTIPLSESVIAILEDRDDLKSFLELVDRAGLRAYFSDPNVAFTMMAPNNDPLEFCTPACPPVDVDEGAVREFVLARVITGEVLPSSDLDDGKVTQFDFGSPQTVANGYPESIAISGAGQDLVLLIEFDLRAANGVVHIGGIIGG